AGSGGCPGRINGCQLHDRDSELAADRHCRHPGIVCGGYAHSHSDSHPVGRSAAAEMDYTFLLDRKTPESPAPLFFRLAHRERYGRILTTRAGSVRYQPLALPGQEEDGLSDRSYTVFRGYRAARAKYTQFDPIGNTYWAIAMGRRIFPHVPLLNLPSITDFN